MQVLVKTCKSECKSWSRLGTSKKRQKWPKETSKKDPKRSYVAGKTSKIGSKNIKIADWCPITGPRVSKWTLTVLPGLGPDPNWAMIRLCRLKWPLIRLSRPKLPLIRPSRPKWSLIRLSRLKFPLIRPNPDHCPDYSALSIRPKFRPLSRL